MNHKTYDHMHSKEELLGMIAKMEEVSSAFYHSATHTGNHAFIEFCGLMNEYIKICENTVEKGGDFTCCNTHTGESLIAENYHIEYLFEKLECIYGPTIKAKLEEMLKK